MKLVIVCHIFAMAASCCLAAERIQMSGSDTLLALSKAWESEFETAHPQVRLTVRGGGSSIGYEELRDGKVHIAMMSRPMTADEKETLQKTSGGRLLEIPVAVDGVAIYVHETNPLRTLTLGQVKEIFAGRVQNWRQMGGRNLQIHIYTRDSNSGTYDFFRQTVLSGENFAAGAEVVPTTKVLVQRISRNPRGIGFGGIAYAEAANRLRISTVPAPYGVAPTAETIADGSYPLARTLYFYVNPVGMEHELEEFFLWVFSNAGQAVLDRAGYFRLPESKREELVAMIQEQL